MSAYSLAEVPLLPLGPEAEGLDAHKVLKEFRDKAPLARAEMGLVLALRHRHLDLVTSDATRQIETETKIMQGISSQTKIPILSHQ